MLPEARPGYPVLAGGPLLVAHRGGAGLAPENTLEAFRSAVDRWSADMIELDVRLSRDGVVVVVHDPTVERTTDGIGPVAGLSLAELEELDAGYRFVDPEGGFPFRGKGVKIPTLEEVLRELPETRFTVEVKAPGAWEAAVRVVRAEGAERRVVMASAERHFVSEIRFDGAVSADRRTLFRAWLSARLPVRRLRRCFTDADLFQAPAKWRGLTVASRRFVRAAHALNIPVQVWTVNDPTEMRRLLALDVDGIQSDRPDLLAEVLGRTVEPRSGNAPIGRTDDED